MTQVYGLASYTNPLHSDVFPGVCKMEAEVVRISANLFHGGSQSCGTVSTLQYFKVYALHLKLYKPLGNISLIKYITFHIHLRQ